MVHEFLKKISRSEGSERFLPEDNTDGGLCVLTYVQKKFIQQGEDRELNSDRCLTHTYTHTHTALTMRLRWLGVLP